MPNTHRRLEIDSLLWKSGCFDRQKRCISAEQVAERRRPRTAQREINPQPISQGREGIGYIHSFESIEDLRFPELQPQPSKKIEEAASQINSANLVQIR